MGPAGHFTHHSPNTVSPASVSLLKAPSQGNAVKQWECSFQVSPFSLSGFLLQHLLCSYLWVRLLGVDWLERAKEIAR